MTPLYVELEKAKERFRAIVARHYFRKWLPLSIIIGIAAGLSAIAFYEMLRHATSLFLIENFLSKRPMRRKKKSSP